MLELLHQRRPGLNRLRRAWYLQLAARPQAKLIAWCLVVVALARWGWDLPSWLMNALWALLLVGTGIAVQRNAAAVFGPVLTYDLVRTARRGRHIWLRIAYAGVLLVMIYLVWTSWFSVQFTSIADVFTRVELPLGLVAEFGEAFFLNFLAVQYAAIFLLTPIYTAGAIAEEKERRTLEYMLSTDLLTHEIILGKLASRLSSLTLLVLAGLPILSLMQFFGGVDLGLLLAGFTGTLLTMLSLGSLSIYMSVREPRTLDAVFWTYFYAGAYLLLSACIPVVNWGNIGYVLYELGQARGGASVGSVLLGLLGNFALFHMVFSIWICTHAIRRLRPADQREVPILAAHRHRVGLLSNFPPRVRRPRLADRSPLFWKELHAEPQIGSHRLGAYLMYFFLVLGWFLVAFAVLYLWLSTGWNRYIDETPDFAMLRTLANGYLAPTLSMLGCAALLVVALTAAATVSREKAQQTLDSLLTAPFATDQILLAKWVGSVFSVRAVWWCVGCLLLVGLITGGIHVLSAPLFVLSWTAQAAFVAAIGLWFSVQCASTLRATTLTFGFALVLVGLGPIALSLFVAGNGHYWMSHAAARQWAGMIEAALAPHQNLMTLVFPHGGLSADSPLVLRELLASMFAPLIYGGAAALLWLPLRRRFRQMAGRVEETPADRQPPAELVPPVAQPLAGVVS
ncbi:MAG: ABC transporter permease subunit [Planctomycetia bacterium]|nr:ABC transporter permease subunit [Planctomycetia bacterium]